MHVQNQYPGQNAGQNCTVDKFAGQLWRRVDKMPVSEIFLISSISSKFQYFKICKSENEYFDKKVTSYLLILIVIHTTKFYME